MTYVEQHEVPQAEGVLERDDGYKEAHHPLGADLVYKSSQVVKYSSSWRHHPLRSRPGPQLRLLA